MQAVARERGRSCECPAGAARWCRGRRHWVFIIAWLIILVGLLAAKNAVGGEYVNNYTVSGSDSAVGLDLLNKTFPQQGGYGGQIVFHAKSGTVSAQQSAVDQSVSNVSKLPDVIKAVSPFASSNTGAVSKDGTTAYASVGWNVNPDSLDTSYLGMLNNAVAPATKAGLQVEYGGGAGEIGQKTSDVKSEVIGLACALVLLLIMFWSLMAAAIPLVSAIFSVLSGLALLALLARVITFPTTAPTIATLLGLGVAVDYGLFLVARHREQLDAGMDVVPSVRRAAGTSGAAIVVAGCTVAVSVLGLYISGVGFVGALGLAAALVVVVTMICALTLVPAFMGLFRQGVRALTARARAHKEGLSAQQQAAATAAATHEQHEHSAFARWGRMVSAQPWPWGVASVVVLLVLAIPLFSITLGQPDNGTNPTSDSSRRAYDLISQGFGVGANGPLTVVVKLPNQSSSDNSSLLSTMQSDISKTAGVASVTPAAINSSGTTAVFNVIPTTRPQATQTAALVNTLRQDVLPKEHATSYVTGTTAGGVDFTSQITSRLVWLILAVVALSFILLTVAFRSVVIAAKAAILNILSIGAAYGVMVAIFEWGLAAGSGEVPVECSAELHAQHGGDGVAFEGRTQVGEGLGFDASAQGGRVCAVFRGDRQSQVGGSRGSLQRSVGCSDAGVAPELIGDRAGGGASAQHRCPLDAVGFERQAAYRLGAGLCGHPPQCQQGDDCGGRGGDRPYPSVLCRVRDLGVGEQGRVRMAENGGGSVQAAGQDCTAGQQEDQPDDHEPGAADVRGVTGHRSAFFLAQPHLDLQRPERIERGETVLDDGAHALAQAGRVAQPSGGAHPDGAAPGSYLGAVDAGDVFGEPGKRSAQAAPRHTDHDRLVPGTQRDGPWPAGNHGDEDEHQADERGHGGTGQGARAGPVGGALHRSGEIAVRDLPQWVAKCRGYRPDGAQNPRRGQHRRNDHPRYGSPRPEDPSGFATRAGARPRVGPGRARCLGASGQHRGVAGAAGGVAHRFLPRSRRATSMST